MGPEDRHMGVARATDYVGDVLVIQPDGLGGVGGASGFGEECIQSACQAGFLYRPLDPRMNGDDADPEGSCSLDVAWEGGIAYSRPVHDPRVAAMCPHVEKGEALVYGGSESVVSVVRVCTTGKVKIGKDGETVPCVRAPELLDVIAEIEKVIEGMSAATMPPTTGLAAAFKAALVPLKESLKAKLVEVT